MSMAFGVLYVLYLEYLDYVLSTCEAGEREDCQRKFEVSKRQNLENSIHNLPLTLYMHTHTYTCISTGRLCSCDAQRPVVG